MFRYISLKSVWLYLFGCALGIVFGMYSGGEVTDVLLLAMGIHGLTFFIIPIYLLSIGMGYVFSCETALLVRCGSFRNLYYQRIKSIVVNAACFSFFLILTIGLSGDVPFLLSLEIFFKFLCLFLFVGLCYITVYEYAKHNQRIGAFGLSMLIPGLDYLLIVMGVNGVFVYRFMEPRGSVWLIGSLLDIASLLLFAFLVFIVNTVFYKKRDVL